jgi:hypothetical protein
MSEDRLEEILSSIKNGKSSSRGNTDEEAPRVNELQKVDDIQGAIVLKSEDEKGLGFMDRLESNRLKSKKKLAAQSVIFDAQIEKLKHQADATKRQSKAYWDAKSVDFSEGLKTYAQQSMQLLEVARQENKSNSIVAVYEKAHQQMESILKKELPNSVKKDLIEKIVDVRDATVKRIEQDVLANKYDLGPE